MHGMAILIYFSALSAVAAVVLAWHRWGQRLRWPMYGPLLGALGLLYAVQPSVLAFAFQTVGLPVFAGILDLPTSGLAFIALALFLSLLLVLSMEGSQRARSLWAGITLVDFLGGIAGPLLALLFISTGGWQVPGMELGLLRDLARIQVAGAIALPFSLACLLVAFQTASVHVTRRWRLARPLLSMLIAGWVHASISATLGYIGTAAWPRILPGELINWTISVLMMAPVTTAGWAYLERRGSFRHWSQAPWMRELLDSTKQMDRLEGQLQLLTSARSLILRGQSAANLLCQVSELLVASGRYRAVWIGFVNQGGDIGEPGAASGAAEADLRRLSCGPWREAGREHPVTEALRMNHPVIVRDIALEAVDERWRENALGMGFRSVAMIPMRLEGKGGAVLAAYLSGAAEFDDDEIRLLRKLADDLAYRLQQLRVVERRLKRLGELEAIWDINTYMISQPDIPLVLQAIVKKAAVLLEADGGVMFLSEPHLRQVRCVVSYQTAGQMEGMLVPFGQGIAGAVAERARPVNLSQPSTWQGADRTDPTSKAASTVCAPMSVRGEVTGVLGLERVQGKDPFSDEEMHTLTLFANQAALVLQNAQLIEDARRKVNQLERLNALTRAAIAAPNISALGRILVEHLSNLVEAQGGLICLNGARPGSAQVAAAAGSLRVADEEHAGRAWALKLAESMSGSFEPRLITSEAELMSEAPGEVGGQTILALPLMMGEFGLGAAVLGFDASRELQEQEIQICSQAAAQASLALSKLQSIDAEKKRSSELEALRQASLSVTSILDLEAVLEAILAHALRLVDADDAHIFIDDAGQLTFGAALWAGSKQREPFSQPREGGLTHSVARTGKRMLVPDVNAHELFENWRWGGAIAGFPLRIGSRILGVMNVAWSEPHDFLQEEIRAMELLADQAAIAIANLRLFERMDAERQRVQLLYDLTSAIASSLDPAEILRRAVQLTTENFRATAGVGFLLEAESGKLTIDTVAKAEYFGETDFCHTLDLKLGKGLEGWVAENRQAVMISDIRSDERWTQFQEIDYKDIRSVVSAPILAGVQTLGVISILDEAPFKPEQLDLLKSISQQVGLALSNAKRYQMTVRQLRERTVLQQVAQVVTKRLEIQPLVREITRQVGQELGYPVVELFLVQGDVLVLRDIEGLGVRDQIQIPLEEGVVGRVARTNQAALVPDVEREGDYIPGVPGMKSEIAVPLRKADVVVGVLNVETPVRYGLGQDDLRLLSLLADQVSIALENAALYERLRTEAQKLERTVAERTAALAEALEQAREANLIKTQFVSDVSHELRTPLTNIRLYLELLETGQPARFASYLDTLQRETDRLVTLIEDLLAISRLDAGTSPPSPVSLDLNRLASSLVEDRRRLFSARELKLEFKPDSPLSPIFADERMLTQVVANLLTNALNYTPPGGRVIVSTRESAVEEMEWVTLTVTDTGLGIGPEDQDRIFERFYRGSAAREGGKPGTGLGLAICKEILERHGGRITVESKPQKGSSFTIWLPKRAESVASQSWTGASGIPDEPKPSE
jgi:signal transduction histidine kinase